MKCEHSASRAPIEDPNIGFYTRIKSDKVKIIFHMLPGVPSGQG